ncbi:MAG: glycine oxidase [Solirubrobacteraceae bacterium]|jgi:glycine oxidase|nr:glycine oxidase [Solirubrobacteraceae bacterium]
MSERNPAAVDVAVIGGGVIGLAIAWRAQAHGLRTVVLERGEAGQGTSRVAAGMLAPISEATPAEEPLLELGLRSAQLYPELVHELDLPGYRTCGTLLVARDGDEAEALERELALRERYGLEVERLRPSAARRLEPGLAPAVRLALSIPGDHAIDPRQLTAALAAALRAAGGRLREGAAVAAVDIRDGVVTGIRLAGGEVVPARAVVIAAGAWSDQLEGLPPLERPALRPVKGQILRLHDPAGPGLLTRVVRMGASYIVPRGDGRYVIGATSEERGFDTTVTAGAAFALLREASELVPGISELVLDEFSAGLRPGTADNLPVIGPSATPGLHWATGHGRGGVLLAPVTAEIILAGLLGDRVAPGRSPFSPARFGGAAVGSAA